MKKSGQMVSSHVVRQNLETEYAQMSREEQRENEALEWAEATFGDIVHETGGLWWVNFEPSIG